MGSDSDLPVVKKCIDALKKFEISVDVNVISAHRTPYEAEAFAKNAENKILILKNYIAGKVMYSARNDMARENWPSAINRLQSIVQDAQETVMPAEAMYRLTECYTAIGLPEQAAGYAKMLETNFPDNEWTLRLKSKKK